MMSQPHFFQVKMDDIVAYKSLGEGFKKGTSGVLIVFLCFFKADPVFLSKVEGLKPDAAKHETFFQVEPNTGTPVNLAARFQVG